MGVLVKATIWTSNRPSIRLRASRTALRASSPAPILTWVRTAVAPFANSSSRASVARSAMSSGVNIPADAAVIHASMAPIRSPLGLGTCSAVRALSKWACGSAMAPTRSQPARSSLGVPAATGVPDLKTADTKPSTT